MANKFKYSTIKIYKYTMPIISFAQTKGGVGKTTLSLSLAHSKTFQKAFGKVALVELDRQGSIAKSWLPTRITHKRKNKNVQFYSLPLSPEQTLKDREKKELIVKLEEITNEYDLVILDVPGESIAGFSIKFSSALSDLILIPCRTSFFEEQSFGENFWPTITANFQDSKFCMVPFGLHPSASHENVHEYFSDIMPAQITCLEHGFQTRRVFEDYPRDGKTLEEYATSVKNNKKDYANAVAAMANVEAIAKDIVKHLQ